MNAMVSPRIVTAARPTFFIGRKSDLAFARNLLSESDLERLPPSGTAEHPWDSRSVAWGSS
jgi:hypothetical protein